MRHTAKFQKGLQHWIKNPNLGPTVVALPRAINWTWVAVVLNRRLSCCNYIFKKYRIRKQARQSGWSSHIFFLGQRHHIWLNRFKFKQLVDQRSFVLIMRIVLARLRLTLLLSSWWKRVKIYQAPVIQELQDFLPSIDLPDWQLGQIFGLQLQLRIGMKFHHDGISNRQIYLRCPLLRFAIKKGRQGLLLNRVDLFPWKPSCGRKGYFFVIFCSQAKFALNNE